MAKRKTQRRRLGRPPHPPESVRGNRVVTFVTDAEYEKLERLAERSDRSLSAAVYEILARSLRRQK